jgi:hypothetical protein
MTADEYKKKLAEIMNSREDQGKISELLTELSDDRGVITAELTLAQQQAADLKAKNASLSDVNMRLFLKVGSIPPADDQKKTDDDDEPAAPDFAKLWQEKK